jgi:hypothetical protein
MPHIPGYVVSFAVAAFGVWLWDLWRGERHDAVKDERDAAMGGQMLTGMAVTLLLLVAALAVQGLGVDAGGWAALVLLCLFFAIFYVGPFVPPLRRRR